MIVFKNHKDIDKEKWDKCIQQSQLPLVYALSWFLDIVSPSWNALIIEENTNYIAVFPLTEKKKYGISYLAQPPFCQQLGLFHLNNKPIEIDSFIELIHAKYRHFDISLNEKNCIKGTPSTRPNLTLNLHPEYPQLAANYSTNRKRDLRKSQKAGCIIKETEDIEVFIDFFTREKGLDINTLPLDAYQILSPIYLAGQKSSATKLLFAYNKNMQLISVALFLISDDRIIFLLGTANSEGRSLGVTTSIFDQIIQQNSTKNRVLDFEGSSIEGVAKFYKSLGGKEKKYISLKGNSFFWSTLIPRIAKLIQRR